MKHGSNSSLSPRHINCWSTFRQAEFGGGENYLFHAQREEACHSLCDVRSMRLQRIIAAGLELSETISICHLRTNCRCVWFLAG
jgi:hypothetical protein